MSAYSNPQCCVFEPARVSRFLRATFPDDTAKRAAAALGCSPRSVENWLMGASAPSALWIIAMIDAFGPDFLEAVMASPPAWVSRAIADRESADLAREIAALQARREQLEKRLA